jgi:hypothetical protein
MLRWSRSLTAHGSSVDITVLRSRSQYPAALALDVHRSPPVRAPRSAGIPLCPASGSNLPSPFSALANSDRRLLGMNCSGPPKIIEPREPLLSRGVVAGKPRERVDPEPL